MGWALYPASPEKCIFFGKKGTAAACHTVGLTYLS